MHFSAARVLAKGADTHCAGRVQNIELPPAVACFEAYRRGIAA
jgi:hypothetical protein